LSRAEPDRAVKITVADGLTAGGDPGLLGVLLENLLANAWKFTAKRPQARIEVGRAKRSRAHEEAFFVRDNGAGFDMELASKLFIPFQRLHAASDFPGTGIGLATCQRVVARHGGRIWAEASTGKGAAFFFTLREADHG
jgi:hypothetical protein